MSLQTTVNIFMVNAYCDFYKENQRQPSNISSDSLERLLATWRNDSKDAADGKGKPNGAVGKAQQPLDDAMIDTLLDVDPNFFHILDAKSQMLTHYCDWFNLYKRQPRRHSLDNMEHSLGVWRENIKHSEKGGTNVPLNEEQKTVLLSVDPDFYNCRSEIKIQQVNNYCDFFKAYNMPPTKHSKSAFERSLARWRDIIKVRDQTKQPIDAETRLQLVSVDPEFFQRRDSKTMKLKRQTDYCDFINTNQHVPKASIEESEESEQSLWRRHLKKLETAQISIFQQDTILKDPTFYKRDDGKNQRITTYCEFYREHQRQPSRGSIELKERSLATWRFHMKAAAAGKSRHNPLNDEQNEQLLAVDHDFYKSQVSVKLQQINDYCAFVTTNNKQPSRCGTGSKERALAQWRTYMKSAANGQVKCNYVALNDEQRARILSVDPKFFANQELTKNQQVDAYCDFCKFNGRPPRRVRDDDIERSLSTWRVNMKTAIKGKSKHTILSAEDKAKVLSADPDFFKIKSKKCQNWCEAIAGSPLNPNSPK